MSDDKKPAVTAVAAFLLGMASVLDLGGTLPRVLREEPLSPKEAPMSDAEALASDWEAVGDAFRTVLGDQPQKAPGGARKGRRGQLRRR